MYNIMNNHIYLDNHINNTNYLKIQKKIYDNGILNNNDLNTKYNDNLNYLKVIYNKIFNSNYNNVLSYSEEKIHEIIYLHIIKQYKKKPHFIVSSENINLLLIFKKLYNNNLISLSIIKPNIYGIITLNDINKYIKKNTYLISLNYSNLIFGMIHDINNITKFCISKNILLSK